MPKMKSNRAAAKRFKKTGGSKVKRGKAYRRHILTSKGPKRKRKLRAGGYVSAADRRSVKKLLPYV